MDPSMKKCLEREACEVIRLSHGFQAQRRETLWLQEKYERFRKEQGLSRAECDRLLYEKTFARPADGASCAQRIRFWRTGRYYPRSRMLYLSFAKALELSPDETKYSLQFWGDMSDRCFSEKDMDDSVYQQRTAFLKELSEEFLHKIPPREIEGMCAGGTAAARNLRHIYCVRAAQLTSLPDGMDAASLRSSRHITSATYAGQFAAEMRLMGEISRNTMIRHLFVFSIPFISKELLDERLLFLGYRSLSEENSDRSGNAVDSLWIRILTLYETACSGRSVQECMAWLQEVLAFLDHYFAERMEEGLRVIQFQHLRNQLASGRVSTS